MKKKQLLISIVACVVLAFSCSQPSSWPQPAPSASAVATQLSHPLRALRPHLQSTQSAPDAVDPRTPQQLAQAACGGGKCVGSMVKPILAASGSTPIIPPSWTVPNWYIDPANSATCASDTNSGTSATCTGGCSGATCTSGVGPLLTYAELAQHRWGTYSPRLQQTTTRTWLSAQASNGDPVYSSPYLEGGSSINDVCSLGTAQIVLSTHLTAVTAKSRGTNQPLSVTLASSTGVVQGMLALNTTHSSYAWLYRNTSGNIWTMSQPFAPITLPYLALLGAPTEVDTWSSAAGGDAITIYKPSVVNFIADVPTFSQYNAGITNGAFIQHCNVASPAGDLAAWTLGQNGALIESAATRTTDMTGFDSLIIFNQGINVYASGSYALMPGASSGENTSAYVLGGVIGSYNGSNIMNGGSGLFVDGDTIFAGTSSPSLVYNYGGALGLADIESGAVVGPNVSGIFVTSTLYGIPPEVYGAGSLDALANGQIEYLSGAANATATFKLTGSLRIGFQTTSCIGVPSVALPTLTCNITVSATTLDANLGATNGCLYAPGGGSFCNYGE